MLFDLNTDFGTRVSRRLQEEHIIWLITVRDDLTPQPIPVWFLWDGKGFLIYSQPDKQKLRNIARHPRVSLHFNSDGRDGDIIVFWADAEAATQLPPANQVEAYTQKYQEGFRRIGMTAEEFASSYAIPIRVIPFHVSGH